MAERKWIYVLRGGSESHATFGARMRTDISRRLLELQPARLDLTVTDAPPPKVTLFPFKREPIAIFNIHADVDDPARFEAVLEDAGASLSGYAVEESYPVAFDQTWRDGEATPTPILLTMLRKKAGISEDEFIQRWHHGHTPLSLEIHPLCYYQRNVVRGAVTDGAPPSDGIVIEACPTRGDLLNPTRFFGGALKMVPNMLRVAKDINGFLDMKQTETYYATEYRLRS